MLDEFPLAIGYHLVDVHLKIKFNRGHKQLVPIFRLTLHDFLLQDSFLDHFYGKGVRRVPLQFLYLISIALTLYYIHQIMTMVDFI